jgi:Holliday junction resolvase-like predicted endonuclease
MPPGRCRPGSAGASSEAAQYWLSGHPDYAGHDIAFDVVLAAPWAWPRYIENAFSVQ